MKLDSNDTVQIFTKIQETPSSSNLNLNNKEVGFFVHVQTDRVYKLKNCVDSQKTNADFYKKFSKDFIRNIRKGQNQMLICCAQEQSARVQTSIGCKKNPGMLLIAGIAILDEKYQQDFMKFDIQISFMQYSEGNLYDLLAYTKKPLKMTKCEQNIYFGESYCKITTFSQFLKLLKIALFNNKERDLKSQSSSVGKKHEQKLASTLIMTIATKKYSNSLKLSNTVIQKTVVIDFAASYSSGFQSDSTGQKNVWDYFLIELNNMTCRKKMHYHLVEPNPLLSLTKSMLKNGKTYILSSFSTNPTKFDKNYKYYCQLSDTVDLITKQIEINFQNTMGTTLRPRLQNSDKEKQFSEAQMLLMIVQAVGIVERNVKNKKYSSLRQYRDMKQKNKRIIEQCLDWIQSYRKLFGRMFENKRVMKLAQNQIIGDQIKLIGICVKSQNYKQFYEAKSYLTLQREVNIKIQTSRQQIIKLSKQKYEMKDKFNELKSKHWQQFLKISPEVNQISNIKYLINRILDFLSKTFFSIMMAEQRTIADQIIKQQHINQNLTGLCKNLAQLDEKIGQISKKGTILFDVSELKRDAHLSLLVKEVQEIMSKQQRRGKKQSRKQESNKQNSKVMGDRKFTKLPVLAEKRMSLEIMGSFEFASLLINPDLQQSDKA